MADAKYQQRLNEAGRNDTCPCGSGKKYKKCHLQADEELHSKAVAKAQEKAAAEAEKAEAEGGESEEKQGDQGHPPEGKKGKYEPKTPRAKPTTGSRQVAIPRKAG